MPESDIDILKEAIQHHWPPQPGEKAGRYIGKFFDRSRLGAKISGKVVGNHGTYTVAVWVKDHGLYSACSCYIGKHGGCHHCWALALTFLNDESTFPAVKTYKREEIQDLTTLSGYLAGITLESLLNELKANGITQKAFAESIGMSSAHLTAIKSSELRMRFYNELGATKVACLWVLERFGKRKEEM